LLRQRLRNFNVAFLVPSYAFLARNLWVGSASGPNGLLVLFHGAVNVQVTALALALWSRRPLSLRQLRAIDLKLFSCIVTFFAWLHYEWFQNEVLVQAALRAQGPLGRDMDLERLTGASAAVHWILLIVVYGVFIPNTWRRTAAVVAVGVCLPLGMTLGLGLLDDGASGFAAYALVDQSCLIFFAAVVAVFGSYRIGALQREVAEARRLGPYRLKERLGVGGMGEVYLAEHLLLRRPCAVKLIRPERAGDPRHLRRFELEVQATAALTHPNTVQVYDYGHAEDGTFYYDMEYLPGLSLEELVTRYGPLSAARAVHLLRQICGALSEAHATGLVHRDLKPGNVIVGERGGLHDTAKIVDFGLVLPVGSGLEEAKLTQDGAVTGTPA
jgi:serine/threonine-protein kinase